MYMSLTKSSTRSSRFSQASSGVSPYALQISKKSAAGSCLYCVFLSIQFHSRISFLVIVKMICFTVIFLTLQRWTDYVSVVCREGYIRMKNEKSNAR